MLQELVEYSHLLVHRSRVLYEIFRIAYASIGAHMNTEGLHCGESFSLASHCHRSCAGLSKLC